jgi:hypothetical protein
MVFERKRSSRESNKISVKVKRCKHISARGSAGREKEGGRRTSG